jgi:antitoxin ParD1/3/4
MNVSLTKELEKLVTTKVKSGLYHTASEVVREGLRLLEERDRLYALRLDELRRDVRRGLDSPDAGPLDVPGMKERVRKAFQAKKKPRRSA